MKDLQPLIARVAVLRNEDREANRKMREATEAREEARDKLSQAERELDKTVQENIDSLTQAPE
jgi:vacuolar-type H+-ATPase subunit H